MAKSIKNSKKANRHKNETKLIPGLKYPTLDSLKHSHMFKVEKESEKNKLISNKI